MYESDLSTWSAKVKNSQQSTHTLTMSNLSQTTFKFNNKMYTIDMVNQPGLWRQNAMTWYQSVLPFVIVAREVNLNIDDSQELFYLIYTREDNWVQVDLTTGKNIMNIISSTP